MNDASNLPAIPGVLARLWSGMRDALRLMRPDEVRRAIGLCVSAIVIGLLQIAVVGAIYGILRWGFDAQSDIPAWIGDVLAAVLGSAGRREAMAAILVAASMLVLLKTLLSYRQTYSTTAFIGDCERRLSSELLYRVLMSPYQWLVRQNVERVRQHAIGFVSVWSRDVVGSLVRFGNDLFSATLLVALMLWYDPRVGAVVLLAGGAVGAALFLVVRPRLRRLGVEKRDAILEINTISKQCMDGLKDIKLTSGEHDFAAEFEWAMRRYADVNRDAQALIQLPRHVLEAIAYLAVVAVGAYVTLGSGNTPEVVGALLLYALAAMRLLPMLSTMISTLSSLTAALPVVANIHTLVADTAAPDAGGSTEPWPTAPWQAIRFENVSLSYKAGKRPALDALDVTIERGRRYGLIGQSGAGKSSFLDVFTGLLSPSEGAVRIDGAELTELRHLAWRRHFGSVTQHPFLIDATLRENIVFQRGVAADPDRMARALRLACLEGVAARLPGGIEGRIGERGALLSGGERQRVAIARAIYRGADILILDEPTSALDAIVEDEIAESLRSLYGQVTSIVVSHRATLIKDCDEIWLFDAGRLVSRGSHEELKRSSDLYQRMLDSDHAGTPEAA